MFARVKKSGPHEYLQIVENRRVEGKVAQRVIATVGRLDRLNARETLKGWFAPCPSIRNRLFWSCRSRVRPLPTQQGSARR
jgi:hypothetical protein